MNSMIRQRSQEISTALLRVAAYIRRAELRKRIEHFSYTLIEESHKRSLDGLPEILDVIRGFIVFGRSVFEIEPANASILEREIDGLLIEIGKATTRLDLSDLFSGSLGDLNNLKQEQVIAPISVQRANHSSVVESGNLDHSAINRQLPDTQSDTAIMRQQKIIDKIRQLPDRRLHFKDLMAAFPEISERTLRYDLKHLCDQGRLAREGKGGPTNLYVFAG